LVAVAAGASLRATLLVPAEFHEVVSDASLIVRGLVTDVRPMAVPGRGIDSIATVAIEAVLKGEADRFVSVRVPGGEIGSRRFVMVGAPTLRQGQRAVFFLRQDADGFRRPVGLSMGVYRVQADPATGRPVVAPPVVAGWTAPMTGRVVRGDARRRTVPVSEFDSIVRLVVEGRALPSRVSSPARRSR
jgi:hypothetical protein